jgi:hypothetical protein
VVGRGDRGHGHTQANGRNLGTVQEVGAEESNWHKGIEEIDEDASGDLGSLILGAPGSADGQRYHATTHAAAGDDEDGATPEAVDGKEGDEGGQELPSQCAASKGAGVLGGHAQVGLENDSCVHRDEVGTPGVVRVSSCVGCCVGWARYLRHLLVELQEHAETEAVEQLVLSHREHVCHLDLLPGAVLEGVLDALELGVDLDGIQGLGPEGSNDTAGLLGPVFHDEPAGRLGQEVDEGHDDGREDDSNGNGRAPGDGARLELEETEVDPGLESITDADEEAVDDNVAAAVAGAGGLALPDGDDGAELSDTEADEDAADDELCQVEGRGLEDDADERDDTGDKDDVATAELVSGPGT